MTKILKFSFINRKFLILIIGLGLIFSFLPLQENDITYAASCSDPTYKTQAKCQTAWSTEGEELNCYWDVETGTCKPVEWCPGCGAAPHQWHRCFLCLAQYIGSIPIRIAFFIPAIILALFSFVTGFFYALTIAITNWIAKVAASVPISPSSSLMPHDFVVTQAWEFTRDFANMFFILILVFIGLATILKLREYQAKKTLPLLIIIALLINFTPVIVGFIADITNLVTIFFLEKAGTFNNLKEVVERFAEYIQTTLHIWSADGAFFQRLFVTYKGAGPYFAEFVGIVVYGLILTAFYIFGSIVYFFVGILFFTRILFLWILMILAPIAFISYIFPATKKLYLIGWDSWWEELVKWSIIGIPIGFFLWLSNFVMHHIPVVNTLFNSAELYTQTNIQEGDAVFAAPGSIGAGFADLFVSILAPMLAITLLYLGTKFAKKLAPEMAIKIVEGVKKGVKILATSAVAAATLGAGAAGAAGLIGKAAAGAARAEAFLGSKRGLKPFQYLLGKPAKLATGVVEKVAAPRLLRYTARTREAEIPDEFKHMTAEQQVQYMRTQTQGPRQDLRKLQYFSNMKEEAYTPVREKKRDEQGNVIKEKYIDEKGKERERVVYVAKENPLAKEAGDLANRYMTDPRGKEYARAITKMLPNTMDEKTLLNIKLEGKVDSEDIKKTTNELNRRIDKATKQVKKRVDGKKEIAFRVKSSKGKITKKQAARDIAAASIYTRELKDTGKITKGSFDTVAVKMGSLYWDGRQLSKALEEGGKKFVEKWMEAAEKVGSSWFLKHNQKGLIYLSGNTAQDAGFNTLDGYTREQIRELIRDFRARGGVEER